MNAQVIVQLSETGRKADILAGGNGEARKVLIVTPADAEFKEVVEAGTFEKDIPTLSLYSTYYNPYPQWDHIPTVREVLDHVAEKARLEARKEAEEIAAMRAATLAVLTERRTQSTSEYIRWNEERGFSDRCQGLLAPHWPYQADKEITGSPEAVAWKAELDAHNARIKEDFIAMKQAELAAREAKEAEEKASEAARREALGLRDGDEDYQVEDGALTGVPLWQNHKRGRNWMAVIGVNPKSPGGLDRNFAEKAKGSSYYLMPPLAPGDAVEFGADYTSGSGNRSRDRWYGYVVRIDPETDDQFGALILHKCSTGKDAVKQGKQHASTLAKV